MGTDSIYEGKAASSISSGSEPSECDPSGIERSGLRSLIDKRSDNVRKGLSKAFSFGKKDEATLSPVESRSLHEWPSASSHPTGPPPTPYPTSPRTEEPPEIHWPTPPPSTKLPSTPPPVLKRFAGGGRPAKRWSKLRKDPELRDQNGDVLVFLGQSDEPSLRVSSQVIETSRNKYLMRELQQNIVEDDYADGISYELSFPPPPGLTRTESLRHQVTTRNTFALIHRAALVGLSLYQALQDLETRLQREPEILSQLLHYIVARGLDDVRSNPEAAVSILAWSDRLWAQGWREAFVHCVGMYDSLESCTDWSHVPAVTKALLGKSNLEMSLSIQTAEDRLADFGFSDMIPQDCTKSVHSSARAFQLFLRKHYMAVYGTWPPVREEGWLTRSLVTTLQQDLGALYELLVDRDVSWDVSEARAGRKWMMASCRDHSFDADSVIPMTDIVIEFDNRARIPHIPGPHPLLPEHVPASRQRDKRVALAYTESVNMDALERCASPTDLLTAFSRFEKEDLSVDPQLARRARWIVLYGALQTLAAISVDTPGLKYSAGVDYHLIARVKAPSWAQTWPFSDPSHSMSYCFLTPDDVGPPGMSTSPSSTKSSTNHDLPIRQRMDMTSGLGSLGSFLKADEKKSIGTDAAQTLVIRDFDEEP